MKGTAVSTDQLDLSTDPMHDFTGQVFTPTLLQTLPNFLLVTVISCARYHSKPLAVYSLQPCNTLHLLSHIRVIPIIYSKTSAI